MAQGKIEFSMPELLFDKVHVSDIYGNYNARGNLTSFGVDLTFSEMCVTIAKCARL